MTFLIRLEDIDNGIRAIRDILEIYDTEELKEYLCKALEMRSLILLNNNKESESNDVFN